MTLFPSQWKHFKLERCYEHIQPLVANWDTISSFSSASNISQPCSPIRSANFWGPIFEPLFPKVSYTPSLFSHSHWTSSYSSVTALLNKFLVHLFHTHSTSPIQSSPVFFHQFLCLKRCLFHFVQSSSQFSLKLTISPASHWLSSRMVSICTPQNSVKTFFRRCTQKSHNSKSLQVLTLGMP